MTLSAAIARRGFRSAAPDGRFAALSGAPSWLPILIFSAVGSTLGLIAGFRFKPEPLITSMVPLSLVSFASSMLLRRHEVRAIGFFFNALLQFLVIAFASMLLTYAAATLHRPLADGVLIRVDLSMGYDWRGYAEFVSVNTTLVTALARAYTSIFMQPVALLALLTLDRRFEQAQCLLLATMISLILTAAIFAVFPATTAWTATGVPEHLVAPLHLPVKSTGWIHDLLEIRAGRGRLLDPNSGSALVAFPSFHATAALLYCWAAWPLRNLRPAFFALNAAMIAATPIFGGHYLADLLGGAAVTACSIPLARLLQLRLLEMPRNQKPETCPR